LVFDLDAPLEQADSPAEELPVVFPVGRLNFIASVKRTECAKNAFDGSGNDSASFSCYALADLCSLASGFFGKDFSERLLF
jgi:hypothetical protein